MSAPRRPQPTSPQAAKPPSDRQRATPSRRRAWFQRSLALVAAVTAGLLLSAGREARLEANDVVQHHPHGQLIDVGGRRLHLDCSGTSGPTVVIDAGLGDWSMPWRAVQQGVARTTRVCTYDRAGMGYSDPGPRPRDADTFAGELHALLARADVPGPYVLVGHSLGGLTVRVFTHRYPRDVAGVVLVESMSPQLATSAHANPSGNSASRDPLFTVLTAAARLGLIRALAGPLGLADGIPPEDAAAYVSKVVTPRNYETVADEMSGIPASLAQAGNVTTFGKTPLIVVSRGRDLDPDWVTAQRGLLSLSSNSRQVTAQDSGHGIEFGQPQAVIDAIVSLVGQLR